MITIIQARYRDIPWEETGCWYQSGDAFCASIWPRNRGKAVLIRVPAENRETLSHCTQPRYVVVNDDGTPATSTRGKRISVCPHIVEIGD